MNIENLRVEKKPLNVVAGTLNLFKELVIKWTFRLYWQALNHFMRSGRQMSDFFIELLLLQNDMLENISKGIHLFNKVSLEVRVGASFDMILRILLNLCDLIINKVISEVCLQLSHVLVN